MGIAERSKLPLDLAVFPSNQRPIASSMTFIAPVNAISYNNAKPIFMDVDRYYTIDINKTVNYIQIIDINGKIINNLKNSKEFNITNQKNGLYLVHIVNKEKIIIKKIIKN